MLGDSTAIPTIAVKDIEAAKKFYGDVLGLKQKNENEGGVMYQSGSGGVFVYPSEFAGTNQATYANWSVDDLDGLVSDLKSKGVEFKQYDNMPGITHDGDIHSMGEFKMAWFTDPDGNILAIDNGAM